MTLPKFLLLNLTFLLLTAACSKNSTDENRLPANELKTLDILLRDSHDYSELRSKVIDSLKVKLSKLPDSDRLQRLRTMVDLGDRYRGFCSDSSVIFYHYAIELAQSSDTTVLTELRIKMINALASSGIFTRAESFMSAIDTTSLSANQKIEYAKAGRQLYSYMRGYLGEDNEITPAVTSGFENYDEYLRTHLPAEDNYLTFLQAEKSVREGHNREALGKLEVLLKKLPLTSNLYGMAAFQAARASHNMGDDYSYGRYLAMAAQSDIKCAVKETLALPALAEWLYSKGDMDRAYRYINVSLNDANSSNSRMRTVSIANFVPIIDNSYRQRISASRDELMIYFLLVTLLCIVCGTLLFIFLRNLRRSNQIRQKLHTQAKMQENYIGHFLGMCASYADKLESTRKLVQRKLAAGQAEELLKMVKYPRTPEDQPDDFFKVFDETFLDLYPDFIDNFNTLLREDSQIKHEKGAALSTELRIYAFLRLGVKESVRIAQILRCSPSTIYTYRNKMRNRAIDRERFEEKVARLGESEE